MSILDTIFKTTDEVRAAFLAAHAELQEFGEVSPETHNRIFELCRRRDEVVTELGSWLIQTEARAEALKAEYAPILQKIKEDQEQLDKRAEFIRWALQLILPVGEQVINETVDVRYRRSERVEVADEKAVPLEYMDFVPTVKKREMLAALKGGENIPGARVIENFSVQVKVGGEKAIALAARRAKAKRKEMENESEE